jgi:3-oxoacyl-[acyl-carrier protein] reductase
MRLKGKIALITGSASGIGKGTALMFAKEGADLILNDINLARAEEVAQQVRKIGRKALTLMADVSHRVEVDEMLKKGLEEFQKVDILVNNAGYAQLVPFSQMDPEDWDRMFAVHVKGAFNCTRGLIQLMIEQKYGRIINISSVAAYGEEMAVHYSAAKAALIGFTKSLAKEAAPFGITVNAIAPGLIDTPILKATELNKETADRIIDHFRKRTVVGRIGQPEDIAAACTYLASDEAGFVTGQVISPNGGYYM